MRQPLYFGCWRESGHYLFEQGMQTARRDGHREFLERFIDGTLCPSLIQTEGLANLTHLNRDQAPLTVLSFWDRSVDHRPGSNSNFILPGVLSYAVALAEAMRVFPEIFARLKFDIVEWKP